MYALGCTTFTDPPLPAGAVRLTPPAVYARWWDMVESCSGQRGDIGAVSWYVIPGASAVPPGPGHSGEAAGYYASPGREVVLAGTYQDSGAVVRHEMLHALLDTRTGHPRAQFLGTCAGVVACQAACVTDAGPAPAPPAGAVVVPASALDVGAALTPSRPSASDVDGRFTLTVTATNYWSTPVVLAPQPARAAAGFGYRVATDPPAPVVLGQRDCCRNEEPVWDASTTTFAAGETKRFVFDFRVTSTESGRITVLPPGSYTFRGTFGQDGAGAVSTDVPAVLTP